MLALTQIHSFRTSRKCSKCELGSWKRGAAYDRIDNNNNNNRKYMSLVQFLSFIFHRVLFYLTFGMSSCTRLLLLLLLPLHIFLCILYFIVHITMALKQKTKIELFVFLISWKIMHNAKQYAANVCVCFPS